MGKTAGNLLQSLCQTEAYAKVMNHLKKTPASFNPAHFS
jgi:hypothetical protein